MLTWEKIPQLLSRIGPFQIDHPVHIGIHQIHNTHARTLNSRLIVVQETRAMIVMTL